MRVPRYSSLGIGRRRRNSVYLYKALSSRKSSLSDVDSTKSKPTLFRIIPRISKLASFCAGQSRVISDKYHFIGSELT